MFFVSLALVRSASCNFFIVFFLGIKCNLSMFSWKKKSLNLISEQMLDYNVLGGEKNMLFRNNATKPNNGTLRYGWQVI